MPDKKPVTTTKLNTDRVGNPISSSTLEYPLDSWLQFSIAHVSAAYRLGERTLLCQQLGGAWPLLPSPLGSADSLLGS